MFEDEQGIHCFQRAVSKGEVVGDDVEEVVSR